MYICTRSQYLVGNVLAKVVVHLLENLVGRPCGKPCAGTLLEDLLLLRLAVLDCLDATIPVVYMYAFAHATEYACMAQRLQIHCKDGHDNGGWTS